MWPVFKHCYKCTKFDDDPSKNIQVTEKTKFILPILANSMAITPKVLHGIWLVIDLGGDILPTNIFTKFAEYTMKTNKVIERTNTLDAARCTCSHNMSRFFERAYKNGKNKTHRGFAKRCESVDIVKGYL